MTDTASGAASGGAASGGAASDVASVPSVDQALGLRRASSPRVATES